MRDHLESLFAATTASLARIALSIAAIARASVDGTWLKIS